MCICIHIQHPLLHQPEHSHIHRRFTKRRVLGRNSCSCGRSRESLEGPNCLSFYRRPREMHKCTSAQFDYCSHLEKHNRPICIYIHVPMLMDQSHFKDYSPRRRCMFWFINRTFLPGSKITSSPNTKATYIYMLYITVPRISWQENKKGWCAQCGPLNHASWRRRHDGA
jgi:hypothetical protein